MRLISRLLALLLIPFAGMSQTAAVPALSVSVPSATVALPAVVDPGQTAYCTVPRNGGVCTIKLPPRTLLAASVATTKATTATTVATSAPVNLAGFSGAISCDMSQSQSITNPDGSRVITNVNCTIKVSK